MNHSDNQIRINPPSWKVIPEGSRLLRGCHNNPWTLDWEYNFQPYSGAN